MKTTLCWEPKQNTLSTLRTDPRLPHNTWIPSQMPSLLWFCSKWGDDPPPSCYRTACSSFKADGNPVPFGKLVLLPSLNPVIVSTLYVGIKLVYPCHLYTDRTCSLGCVMLYIHLAWSNTSLLPPVLPTRGHVMQWYLAPFLALGLTSGLTGAPTEGTSLYKFQQLSTNTSVSIEKAARTSTSAILVRVLAQWSYKIIGL